MVHLHGMEGGLHWGGELHDGLAADHTVYAIEHVGSGESSGIEELYDFWDLVGHYEEAFDELGLERAALVGTRSAGWSRPRSRPTCVGG